MIQHVWESASQARSLDDLIVAGASAEVARHPLLDLVFTRRGVVVEKRLRGEYLARRADTALEAAVFDEALLERLQTLVLGDALDGRDFGPGCLQGHRDAGSDHPPVDQDRARTANAYAARLLRTREPDVVTQHVHQRAPGGDFEAVILSIDGEIHRM